LHDAGNKLAKALPKLAKAATSDQLRAGFEEHLEQTRGHAARLEEIFEALGEKPTGKKCAGVAGLVKEGEEIMDEDFSPEVIDAALISAAQRIERYENAAYGASVLGRNCSANQKPTPCSIEKTLDKERKPIRNPRNFPKRSTSKSKNL
jgi:ferritin-like metal-binding protein YciE